MKHDGLPAQNVVSFLQVRIYENEASLVNSNPRKPRKKEIE
jgi:hypothetical protein